MASLKPLDVVNVVVRVSMRPWVAIHRGVHTADLRVDEGPLAFCSVTNSSASPRSEPGLPFSARTKSKPSGRWSHLRDVALATHGIDRQNCGFDRQHIDKFGARLTTSLELFRHFDLTKLARRRGAQRKPKPCEPWSPLSRPCGRIGVMVLPSDGHHALRHAGHRVNPGWRSSPGTRSASSVARMSPKWSCAGAPSLNGRKRRSKCELLRPGTARSFGETLCTGQRRKQTQQQDLIERIGNLASQARSWRSLKYLRKTTVSSNVAQSHRAERFRRCWQTATSGASY